MRRVVVAALLLTCACGPRCIEQREETCMMLVPDGYGGAWPLFYDCGECIRYEDKNKKP